MSPPASRHRIGALPSRPPGAAECRCFPDGVLLNMGCWHSRHAGDGSHVPDLPNSRKAEIMATVALVLSIISTVVAVGALVFMVLRERRNR